LITAKLPENKEHSVREAIEHLANHFELTPGERQELLSSGAGLCWTRKIHLH
jgi:restriction endonuclease Mrr